MSLQTKLEKLEKDREAALEKKKKTTENLRSLEDRIRVTKEAIESEINKKARDLLEDMFGPMDEDRMEKLSDFYLEYEKELEDILKQAGDYINGKEEEEKLRDAAGTAREQWETADL